MPRDPAPHPAYRPAYAARRHSPPGSPSNRHRQPDEGAGPQRRPAAAPPLLCCCYGCPGPRPASLLATLGVCCLVVGYAALGAFAFMALEGDLYGEGAVAASKSDPAAVGALRAETVDRLWSITEDLNILYRENWTKLAAEEVLVFQEALFRTLKADAGGAAGYRRGAHKWSFSSSFLYSLTLITTIGYGSVSPHTPWGKLVTILYALIGIPLMLLYLSTTGDVLARSFRRLYGRACGVAASGKPACPCASPVRVPVTLCLAIVLAYICSGAVMFHRLENWSLLEGSYFCFTSLGTIGFGDLVPGQKAEDISLCACSAYILTGMALVAMCFSLVQDEVISLFRYLGASCSKPVNSSALNNIKMNDDGGAGS